MEYSQGWNLIRLSNPLAFIHILCKQLHTFCRLLSTGDSIRTYDHSVLLVVVEVSTRASETDTNAIGQPIPNGESADGRDSDGLKRLPDAGPSKKKKKIKRAYQPQKFSRDVDSVQEADLSEL